MVEMYLQYQWLLLLRQTHGVHSQTSTGEHEEEIKIAAIDNGLAFPFKHPDEWRACKCVCVCMYMCVHMCADSL